MTELVIITLFSSFFLAIVDSFTAFKIGKLFIGLVCSTLGAALMYSGDPLQSIALAFAGSFLSYVTVIAACELLVD